MNAPRKATLRWARSVILWAGPALFVLGACEELPQDPEEPTPLGSVYRFWDITELYEDDEMKVVEDGEQTGGVVDVVHEIDPMFGDSIARAEVFSNETGETYWASVQAPNQSDSGKVGGEVFLNQAWRFRKDSPNAAFRLVVSGLNLDLYDGNPIPLPDQVCEETVYVVDDSVEVAVTDCATVLYAVAEARYWAYPDTTCCSDPFFSTHGYVQALTDDRSGPHWGTGSVGYGPRLFHLDDFEALVEDHGSHGSVSVSLKSPILVDVPLDSIAVGEPFEVMASVTAEAWSLERRESRAAAYFRDPVATNGLSFDAEGVTMLPPPPFREPVWNVTPAPACGETGSGGPGGTIQLDTARYVVSEWAGDEARIAVTRTGGSDGEASVALATGGGTADAGADYESVTTQVRFADGEEGTRVVLVPIIGDTIAEPYETVSLMLSSPSGCAALGGLTSAELIILDDDQPPPDNTHTIGGTVTGLEGGGLVLTNNSTDDLAVTANGSFLFDRQYPDGFVYNVRVDTQPSDPAQSCTVTNGGGTVDGADVTDLEVTCETLPPGDEHLDPTFGAGGKVTLAVNYTGVQGDAPDVALQSDGKVVVVSGNTLARYTADGSLDGAFGAGGVVTVNFYGSRDRLNAVAVQPDGRIVVAGYSQDGANSPTQDDIIVARYNADGTLDPSFGAGGQLVTDFESHQDIAYDLLIQPDGKIVVTGLAATIDDGGFGVYYPDFAAARYSAAGQLDSSFALDGRATTNIAGDTDFGYAAALQADGKIVLTGRVAPSGGANPDLGTLRYNADGSLDSSFGNAGIVRHTTALWDEAADVAVQPDGKIVVAGFTLHEGGIVNPAPDTLTVERYNADGSYDATFGTGGRVQSPVMYPGRAVALQSDGGIVVVGVEQSGASADFAIARFDPSGALDPTFGTNGLVQVDFFGDLDIANAVALQLDGKVIVVGAVRNGANTLLGLVRAVP
jgi:uncharacterized delta-60 repeat protein